MKYFFLIAALYSATCHATNDSSARIKNHLLEGGISAAAAVMTFYVACSEWSCPQRQITCHPENVGIFGIAAAGGAGNAVYNFWQAYKLRTSK